MTKFKTLCAAAMIAATGGAAIADGHIAHAIGARQSQMQLYAFNLGVLGAMAKGQRDYDAAVASGAAGNLAALTSMDQSQMWPQGSDSGSTDSRAKPDMWANFPDVMEKGMALGQASAALAATAGDGLEALQAGMGAVGQSCGGCHKAYREPES